jgi:hypothetical protein
MNNCNKINTLNSTPVSLGPSLFWSLNFWFSSQCIAAVACQSQRQRSHQNLSISPTCAWGRLPRNPVPSRKETGMACSLIAEIGGPVLNSDGWQF